MTRLPHDIWRLVVGYVDEATLKDARAVSTLFQATCPRFGDVDVRVRGWRTMDGKRGKAALVKEMQATVTLPNYGLLGDVWKRLQEIWPLVDFVGYGFLAMNGEGDVIDATDATPLWVLAQRGLASLYFVNGTLQNGRASKLLRTPDGAWELLLASPKTDVEDLAAKLSVLTHKHITAIAPSRGGAALHGGAAVPAQTVLYAQ